MQQAALLCGCGGSVGCRSCARRARLNRERFAGQREAVLLRDDRQCQVCGEIEAAELLVHHRQPGARARRRMITLCRRCHPRAHFTYRPSFAFAVEFPLLYALWRELHPEQPEQRLLLGAPARAEQPALFELVMRASA